MLPSVRQAGGEGLGAVEGGCWVDRRGHRPLVEQALAAAALACSRNFPTVAADQVVGHRVFKTKRSPGLLEAGAQPRSKSIGAQGFFQRLMEQLIASGSPTAGKWLGDGSHHSVGPIRTVIDHAAAGPAADPAWAWKRGLGLGEVAKIPDAGPRAVPTIDAEDGSGGTFQQPFIHRHGLGTGARNRVDPQQQTGESFHAAAIAG